MTCDKSATPAPGSTARHCRGRPGAAAFRAGPAASPSALAPWAGPTRTACGRARPGSRRTGIAARSCRTHPSNRRRAGAPASARRPAAAARSRRRRHRPWRRSAADRRQCGSHTPLDRDGFAATMGGRYAGIDPSSSEPRSSRCAPAGRFTRVPGRAAPAQPCCAGAASRPRYFVTRLSRSISRTSAVDRARVPAGRCARRSWRRARSHPGTSPETIYSHRSS